MTQKELLCRLSDAFGIGTVCDVKALIKENLGQYCPLTDLPGLGVTGFFDAHKKHTVLLEAHADEVGMIVTHVDANGFLTVAPCGGIDLRHLPAREMVIHGDKDYSGVFCSTPPHLAKEDTVPLTMSEIKLDSGLGSSAAEHILPGDYVTYRHGAVSLLGSRVSGKSLDDRAGVAMLLDVAKRLYGKELPCNVIIAFCDAEELGHRGSTTAAFTLSVDEAVAVDVSFGDAPDVSPTDCGILGQGPMIGISPVLDSRVTKELLTLAKNNDIPFQTEVMGGATSTDADAISVSKSGIPCGLVSLPLRNMHTEVETVDLADLTAAADLLTAYVLNGGAVRD